MTHRHGFDESTWPFDTPINNASFTTRPVIESAAPILEVYHDHDGDWQFLCGTTASTQDAMLVCLGCMIDRDPKLLQLADLPCGWLAFRETATQPWSRQTYEAEDD